MLTLNARHYRPDPGATPGRTARVTALSVVLHVILIFALIKALQSTGAIQRIFVAEPARPVGPVTERLRFITVTPPVTPRPRPADPLATPTQLTPRVGPERAGRSTESSATGRESGVPTVPLVAPSQVPASIPAPGAGFDVNVGTPASGPLASGRGGVKGLQPGYVDPRLWPTAPVLEYAPKTSEERLDSAVVTSIMRYQDSVAANTYAPNRFERGDWTYRTKDGKRYGVDQQFIRLGKFSIPTALLGLLPLNQMQGNMVENDRQARLAAMRADIMRGAQAAMNEEEFRQAVKKIRARKDKERKEAEERKKTETKPISER